VPAETVLVRHGETEWSLSGQHTSRTDVELTENGRRRAAEIAAQLAGHSFPVVLCSPLLRARQTCELAGFSDVAEIVDELREWDYGEYEGLTTPQIRERNPSWWLWRDGCPGGESPAHIGSRADQVLKRIREAEGDVLAFAHGHILRVIGARWTGAEVAFGARLALSAGAVCVLGFERDTEVLSRWNS
jgi:broad specificity phosphatase PhoE